MSFKCLIEEKNSKTIGTHCAYKYTKNILVNEKKFVFFK